MNNKFWITTGGLTIAASLLLSQVGTTTQPIRASMHGTVPLPPSHTADVVGAWGTGEVVLFDRTTDPLNDPRFIIYNAAINQMKSSEPQLLDSISVPGWPDWYKVDAAIRVGNTAYLFRNSNYLAYDLTAKVVLFGPRAITAGWPGWPSDWIDIDDAVYIDNNRTFFFRDDQYIEYNSNSNQVTRAPSAISAAFGSWPAHWNYVDAVVKSVTDGDKLIFFRAGEYLRYSLAAGKVDVAPQPINNSTWPGWAPSWLQHGISPDAALPWTSNQYLFLKGESALTFNTQTNTGGGVTTPVAVALPNLPLGWRNVDATLNFGNSKVYLFNNSQVLAINQTNGQIAPIYPREFSNDFPGLPGWDHIDAAFYAGNNKAYLFSGEQTVRYDVQTKSVDAGFPTNIPVAFTGLPATWTSINLAVHSGDANVYLHRGAEVVRYNLISGNVEEAPQPNSPKWTGGFLAFPWIANDLRGGAVWGRGPFGKLVQTLSFGAFQAKLLEDLPFQAFATTPSGVQATVTSVTPAVCRVVNGNWVVFGKSIDKGPGLCTLKATLGGNVWLNAIEELESFEILPPGSTPPATWTPAVSATPTQRPTQTPQATTSPASTATSSTGGKTNQSIAFAALQSRVLNESPITINASASSGLTVIFSSLSTDICTVNGNTVTLLQAGTCIIRASQPGNANFNAAPDVGQAFTVAAQGTPQPTQTPIPAATPTPVPSPSIWFLPGLWRNVGPVD